MKEDHKNIHVDTKAAETLRTQCNVNIKSKEIKIK